MLKASRIVSRTSAKREIGRNRHLLQRNDGFKVITQLNQRLFDPIPHLTIDGQSIQLAEPLSVFHWIWSGLPILLLFVGGAIGGALGAGAFWINTRVFRSEMGGIEKYILTGMISAIAVVLLFVFGLLLGILLEVP